jgi:hypothetical protein
LEINGEGKVGRKIILSADVGGAAGDRVNCGVRAISRIMEIPNSLEQESQLLRIIIPGELTLSLER